MFSGHLVWIFIVVFFFKQKTAYEMRISDWSSDVCSSDLIAGAAAGRMARAAGFIFLNPESFKGRMHYLFPNVRARAAAPIDSGNVTNVAHRIQFHWGIGTIPA